ncbi:hypothetical protein F4780DRAFT_418723 [Xylariomycetidae sp. FL0641]|nr:hypothetical protein F4780DRAFT_418723 [Xylariomycetidae sp. FL0641]
MPPEVVSLLSSSPSAPSPELAEPPARPAPKDAPKPARALDYDVLDLTAPNPRKSATGPASGAPDAVTKRTQDADFLYLSDDFDTTRDIGHDVPKKSRSSLGTSPRRRNRDENSWKRTQSALVGSKETASLQSSAMKRWNSMADPIEHSSSPSAPALRTSHDTGKNAPRTSHGPSKDSKPSSTADSFLDDPFESPPRKSTKPTQPSGWSWPQEVTHEPRGPTMGCDSKKRSSNSAFIDLSSDPPDCPPSKPEPSRTKQGASWDPISSSAPEAEKDPPRTFTLNSSDDSDGSDMDDLPALDEIDFSKTASRKRASSLSPYRAPTKRKKAPEKAVMTAEERECERKKKAEAREAEKERKKAEQQRAKEQRALDKEKEKALAEVNKLRTDKKVSTPEMIVDISEALSPTLKIQVEALLENLDVQHQTRNNGIDNVIKWRRKVTSQFNEELGHWEPTPLHIRNEDHVLVIMPAPEFVKYVLAPEGQDLESHVLRMKSKFGDATIVYLIEGLMVWMRRNRNVLNRQFASAVRSMDPSGDEPGAPSSSQPQPARRRNNNNSRAQHQEYIDEDVIEDALLSLQVEHGALIHHTNAAVETANWVAVFTQHISTIPYRRARDATSADAGFCMETGQVRTGDGAQDTYARMLQETNRVTAPIAYGIAARYGTVSELVRGLEAEGPFALEDCRKCANKDGAFSHRLVGQAVSRRMHRIFTSRDPASTAV